MPTISNHLENSGRETLLDITAMITASPHVAWYTLHCASVFFVSTSQSTAASGNVELWCQQLMPEYGFEILNFGFGVVCLGVFDVDAEYNKSRRSKIC